MPDVSGLGWQPLSLVRGGAANGECVPQGAAATDEDSRVICLKPLLNGCCFVAGLCPESRARCLWSDLFGDSGPFSGHNAFWLGSFNAVGHLNCQI